MASIEEMHTAMINRSIRTIKAELEYLTDASIISPQTLTHLLSQIPAQTALHAPISVGAVPSAALAASAAVNTNAPTTTYPPPPTSPLQNLSLNEKQQSSYYQPPAPQASQAPSPAPPPAYAAPPPSGPPPLAHATALYAYHGTDPGDLELQANDHITVTEYMNAEWWKGRSSRTGLEGIFPRSYVSVVEEKAAQQQMQQQQGPSGGYGNMPLEVSGQGDGTGKMPSKGAEMGKKFGKKLGNAAIFGAGATMGADIVNSIF